MVKVVEFGDSGEPRLQHFHIELRRDRLDVVGRHLKREAVHVSRQVQNVSIFRPRISVKPAMARWKAWLCRFAAAGVMIA